MTKFISIFFLIILSCNFTLVKSSHLINNTNSAIKEYKKNSGKMKVVNNNLPTQNIKQTSERMNKFKREQNKESRSNPKSSSESIFRERSRNNPLNLKTQDNDKTQDNVRTKIFFGGGDLSYELSFMKKHPKDAKRMIVTTYDSEKLMKKKYKDTAAKNKKMLQDKGVLVAHDIDATNLKDLKDKLKKQGIDGSFSPRDLYFSHPHTGSATNGIGGTAELLDNFFKSANDIQKSGYLIHIPRIKGGVDTKFEDRKKIKLFAQLYKEYRPEYLTRFPKDTPADLYRRISEKAKRECIGIEKNDLKTDQENRKRYSTYQSLYGFYGSKGIKNYELIKKIRFNSERYKAYKHKETKKDKSADVVKNLGSTEYVFKRRTDPETKFYDVDDSYLSGGSRNSSISYKSSKRDEESGND